MDINQDTQKAWYEELWLVAVLCVTCFPVGIYALWKNSRINQQIKITSTVVIMLVVLMVIGSYDDYENSSEKQWIAIASLQGGGDKKSAIFRYNGGKARLVYNFRGDPNFGMLLVYVVEDGYSIIRDGGFPELTISGSESGESSLSHLRRGDYYLDVVSANGYWDIIVEELK